MRPKLESVAMIREFARQLLTFEQIDEHRPTACAEAALQVYEKLRRSLSLLTGVAGCRSLFVRALTLAKAEVPWLDYLKIDQDGSLVGLEINNPMLPPHELAEAELALIANLIGLLVTFVGESLTLSLIRDIWPQAQDFSKSEITKESTGHE